MENRLDEEHGQSCSQKSIFSLGHSCRNYIFQRCLQSDVAMWPMSCHGTWMKIPFFCCRWNCLPWIFLISLTFPFSQGECFQHLNRVQEHLWKKCSKLWGLEKNETKVPWWFPGASHSGHWTFRLHAMLECQDEFRHFSVYKLQWVKEG